MAKRKIGGRARKAERESIAWFLRFVARQLKADGMKQEDFARQLGIAYPNFVNMMRGRVNVTLAMAMRICTELGCEFSIHFRGDNKRGCRPNLKQRRRAGDAAVAGCGNAGRAVVLHHLCDPMTSSFVPTKWEIVETD